MNRFKVDPASRQGCYHCMTRTVNGERLFGDREKEVLRKMLWQVADFSGVEVLTYGLMNNHFHVLIRVPEKQDVADAELLRRWQVLYPKPTRYEAAQVKVMERILDGSEAATGESANAAEAIRRRLLARMHDVSEFMKTLKQRFTIWFNQSHGRYGPLWSDRFKSVLVEGRGNPLQTMAAYIDLNAVRAGMVKDPKDYRFCGYAEAVSGLGNPGWRAREGLRQVWAAYADGSARNGPSVEEALSLHRAFLFAKGSDMEGGMDREAALRVLEREGGVLPRGTVLRCRVRYFTDGAILGSADFVRQFVMPYQSNRDRKHPPRVRVLKGADWGDLAVIQGLRKRVFG